MSSIINLKPMENIYIPQNIIREALLNEAITRIHIFALGPTGTNIAQASEQWINAVRIHRKASIILCSTPEDSMKKARMVTEIGQFPVFVTCAVYFRLNELFFDNPDCYMFMDYHAMQLDNMQLATCAFKNDFPNLHNSIASHPSPSILVNAVSNNIIHTRSNSEAAMLCASGKADFCITTEQSRRLYSLKTVFNFGSATMIFFFGTTAHGIDILRQLTDHPNVETCNFTSGANHESIEI